MEGEQKYIYVFAVIMKTISKANGKHERGLSQTQACFKYKFNAHFCLVNISIGVSDVSGSQLYSLHLLSGKGDQAFKLCE